MSKIYEKRVNVGPFLKRGEDIKKGDVIEICNEGKELTGEYGPQDVFLVKTATGKEGNAGFNQTSINNLIDGYGKDAINWIGKKVKVEVMPQIGKPPAYFFLHPDTILDEKTGEFIIPSKEKPKEYVDGEVNPEDIPF